MPLADFVNTDDLTDYQAADAATVIGQAQATIRSYCGWHVAPSITETILVDGRSTGHLWLPSLHVTAVDSISNEGTALTDDQFDWSASGYVELRSGYWSPRPRQIEVTFTHGYEDVPADLVGVASAIAARAASSPAGIVRDQSGPFSVQFGTFNGVAGGLALLQHELAILGRYKIPARA